MQTKDEEIAKASSVQENTQAVNFKTTDDTPSESPNSQSLEHHEDKQVVGGLTALLGAGIVVFGISSWNLFGIYQGFLTIADKNFRLEQLRGEIVHFDEVLTMSARMAVATGNLQWETRYQQYDPLLVKAIAESEQIAPDAYRNISATVNEANNKLVELEKKAFDLVRQGKRSEASQILNGNEYERLKKVYADGYNQALQEIKTDNELQLGAFRQRLFISLSLTILTIPVLIIVYLIAVKLIRQYLQERDRSQQSIAALELKQVAAEQERQRGEALQQELVTLLSDVEGAVSGDLTVRAQITAGEIGIVADFFNAIVENLRDVVTQVKLATLQVNSSVNTNNMAIRTLAEESAQQVAQLEDTLRAVEHMSESMKHVATNARQAADASNNAATTAELGSLAIEQSASSILQLRQTVADTTKKVKRLGEASQQISKVVLLIDQIALKTNMLAVNASIEAARAGEEGRGFAVVAEEVGALAAQSATATKEIARIVESIQQETSEVVEAMEASTVQVVEGTHKVEDARKSLNEIVSVAKLVNELFQGISDETTSQVQTSQSVRQVMESLAVKSQKSSETSREVAIALQETAGVANKLQASVETFKV
ncbi:MAG: methyl-accepting chemotaxis protein [Pseudanabaenaceae cyanobacterium bins.39]|nr:methyl-accepting chemotaxis protein [Pseudanabaenaceae cyanobacterium bins.39]